MGRNGVRGKNIVREVSLRDAELYARSNRFLQRTEPKNNWMVEIGNEVCMGGVGGVIGEVRSKDPPVYVMPHANTKTISND